MNNTEKRTGMKKNKESNIEHGTLRGKDDFFVLLNKLYYSDDNKSN